MKGAMCGPVGTGERNKGGHKLHKLQRIMARMKAKRKAASLLKEGTRER